MPDSATAAESLPVVNPRTGEVDYRITKADADRVAAEATRLRAVQPDWQGLGIEGRVALLARLADEIEARFEAISDALTIDTGRRALSRREVTGAIGNIRRWVGLAPGLLQVAERQSALIDTVRYETGYVPYALAGFISPWNYPMTLSLIDAVPALAAGCAVLIKPSEVTPRFAAPLAEAFAAVPEIPASIILGDGETGAALVESVDLICFTGSVPTGRKVGEAAARRFIPAFLELGGKDAVIVLADADLDHAADAVLRGAVLNAGQICLSIERIYVDRTIHDAFVEKLTARAAEAELNFPDIRQGMVGPLIFARQAEVIADHLADAVAKGAKVLTGGKIERHGGGHWLRPTVLTGVDHSMKIMVEESFGPLLPVMAFEHVDQAVALANDSQFGLSGAVIGGSVDQAEAVGRRLQAGGVSINDCALTIETYEPEKTSFNFSGLGGSRMGPGSIHRFVRKQALIKQHGQPRSLAAYAESTAT